MPNYELQTFRALTFHDHVPAFLDGSDTPRAYLERCLETIDEREPVLQGWVSLNPEGARAAADAATLRYKSGKPLSRIDGMPVGIKDLFVTKDMPTKMGSPLFENNFPRQDSACVQAIRQSGGVVLGKTVTSELGMSHPGPTTNPFSAEHTPGGSSSGSAAVVGARMVPAAIGSQVVGSVIRPSAFCANHAIKPTLGALHRGERQGFSHSHIGIHAGCTQDMWNLAWEIAQRSGGDPGYPALRGPAEAGSAVKPTRLITIEAEGWQHVDGESRAAFESLLTRLTGAGVEIITRRDNALVEAFEQAIGDSLALCRDICAYEMRWSLQNLVDEHGGGLSDSLTARLNLSYDITPDDYRNLLLQRDNARRALAALVGLGDAIISLSSCGPAPRLDNGGVDSGISHTTGLPAFNAWTSQTGAPAITIPLLEVNGLPLGVQLIGQHYSDHHLARLADGVKSIVVA
jgi:Asp-tRNA(Asn)/Glu-tRNA(Gln) amidotransferase A subunit family amidase